MLNITDLSGCRIKVVDFDEAIRLTAYYKEYRHGHKAFAHFDRRQKAYWEDMHKKLLQLRTKQQ